MIAARPDLDAADNFLGTILYDPDLAMPECLKTGLIQDDFPDPQRRKIFAAILQKHSTNKPIATTTIAEATGIELHVLDRILSAQMPVTYLEYYAGQIKGAIVRKNTIASGNNFLRNASDPNQQIDVVIAEMQDALQSATDKLSSGIHDLFPALRLDDLQNYTTPPDYSLAGDGWIRRGAGCLFTGGTGLGKTVLANQIAVSLAAGIKILGCIPVHGAYRIEYIGAENDEETLKRDFLSIIKHAKGKPCPALVQANLHIHHVYGLAGAGFSAWLADQTKKTRPDLIIIDPYQAYLPGQTDINSTASFLSFIQPVNQIIRDNNCALLLVAHTPKPKDRESWTARESVYMAAGTSAISNWARTSAELTTADEDICRGDLADRLLDSKLHPEWRGLKTQMVYDWPEADQTLWKQYAELRQHGNAEGDKGKEANEFYKTNREAMDKGGRTGWEHRIRPGEISAMQTAYNIKIDHGDATFAAEYQNAPLSSVGNQYELSIPMILSHAVILPRLQLPPLSTVFVGSVDINRVGLHYCLAAFDQSMTGHTPLYGKHPQEGDLWQKNAPELDRKRAIFGGLKALCDQIAGTHFIRGAQRIHPSLILIDLGYEADVVHRFCNTFAYPFRVIPSAGRAAHKYWIKRDQLISRPYEGCHVQKSDNGPYVVFNADAWRETAQRAFLAVPGAPGGFTLHAAPDRYHVPLTEHLTAEKLVNKYETERGVRWEWVHAPGTHWDFSDALVGCWVAAATSGLSTTGITLPRRRPEPPRRQCLIPIEGEPPTRPPIRQNQIPGRRVAQIPIQNPIY